MKQRFLTTLKVIQIKYAIKLTTIHYAGECVPYSSQACINAGENLGLTPGNFDGNYGYHYAGEYGVKGCYAYTEASGSSNRGAFFYGTHGASPEIKASLDQSATYYRPEGFDCPQFQGYYINGI